MAENPDGTGEVQNTEAGQVEGDASNEQNPLDTFEFAPGVVGLEKARKVYADSSAEGKRLHVENELLKQQLKESAQQRAVPQGPPAPSPVETELARLEDEYGFPAKAMANVMQAIAQDVSRTELASQLDPVIKYGEADATLTSRYEDWPDVGQKAVAFVQNDPIAALAYNTLLQAGEPAAAKDHAYKTYKMAIGFEGTARALRGSEEEQAALSQRRTDASLGPVGGGNRPAAGGGLARSPGEATRDAMARAREIDKNGERGQNADYDIAAQFADILGQSADE